MTTLARWKDLCLDASNGQLALGEFWAAVIGLGIETSPGKVSLEGEHDYQRIWINAVDRPKAVKNRLHLDIDTAAIADLEALGATVLERAEDTGFGWTVMADPEGGEFCAFVREPDRMPAYRLHGVVIDCVDPAAQAAWWGRVLGVDVTTYDDEPWCTLEHATPDPRLTLDFVPVPEPRVGSNRVHWDLFGEVEPLLAAGATHLWDHEGGGAALADPEGNEFCAFPG
ncbi:VOC family protein [Nocardioides bigeumensis]|uniref:VOC family protein n=1 Tax=Nocardioides bigeumensis TaxID=433657 RepID=A0ABN2Y224_9ACTN